MFTHIDLGLDPISRTTIDGVRYYEIPGENTPQKLVSITSVISHHNKEFFDNWRKKVGEEKANKITKKATSRGTDFHTLTEYFLKNTECSTDVLPLSEFLFKIAKPELQKIDRIHCLEQALYSTRLGVAGTVDCIAEYNGELSIIDFKTSKQAKPREWIDHYFVQCAAYACMLYEMTGLIVSKYVIIMACEDGDCVVYEERDKMKYIKLLSSYIKHFVEQKLKQYS